MSEEKKPIYVGVIEKDEKGNYFCGRYLLDYKKVATNFNLGDEIKIKSVIENPSDISQEQYPVKSKDFALANKKRWVKEDSTEELEEGSSEKPQQDQE
ncbi:MAG: hypothetical protein BM557_08275 [Flavobacterium sp. MedPE-SWcel]|uniref:hypothetical protein n=1 Tax=uncultured Flavobacterium sp. TaxID=165435 RepID=UPI000914C8C3|nr:MAG: hypothetical protein BM557_08275 [Flavobacterium sp. MedPE-SWcel]